MAYRNGSGNGSMNEFSEREREREITHHNILCVNKKPKIFVFHGSTSIIEITQPIFTKIIYAMDKYG